jgi:hypothetical protein
MRQQTVGVEAEEGDFVVPAVADAGKRNQGRLKLLEQ